MTVDELQAPSGEADFLGHFQFIFQKQFITELIPGAEIWLHDGISFAKRKRKQECNHAGPLSLPKALYATSHGIILCQLSEGALFNILIRLPLWMAILKRWCWWLTAAFHGNYVPPSPGALQLSTFTSMLFNTLIKHLREIVWVYVLQCQPNLISLFHLTQMRQWKSRTSA